MNRELKKLLRGKIIYILWFTFLLLSFCFAFIFIANNSVSLRSENTSVIEYDNEEELDEIIAFYEDQLSSTTYDKDSVEQNIVLYKFLKDNNISYNQFRLDKELSIFEDNNYKFIDFVLNGCIIGLMLFSLAVSLLLFNEDFSSKTYKYLYTQNKKRSSIFKDKFLTYIVMCSFVFVISIVLVLILSLNFSSSYKYLIFQSELNVSKLTINELIIMSCLSYLFLHITLSTVILSISLINKSVIKTMCFDMGIVVMIGIIISYINGYGIHILIGNAIDIYRYNLNLKDIYMGFSIRTIILLIILSSSIVYYNKRNLN